MEARFRSPLEVAGMPIDAGLFAAQWCARQLRAVGNLSPYLLLLALPGSSWTIWRSQIFSMMVFLDIFVRL